MMQRLPWTAALALFLLPTVAAQGQELTPPVLETPVDTELPPAAVDADIDYAAVTATLYIDETGTVVKVELSEPAQPTGLGINKAALAVLEALTFEPATRNGQPVKAKITFTLELLAPTEPLPPAFVSDIYIRAQKAWSEARAEAAIPRGVLSGEVYERGTRVPLAGVLISARKGEQVVETYTNAQGRFRLDDLEAGTWNVVLAEEMYGEYTTEETIADNTQTELKLYIERLFYDGYGESDYVYETRESALRKEVTRRRLGIAEIQKIPGENGDALKVIQNLPGVARSSFNAGTIVVRGSSPEDSIALLDGVQVPLLYHFGAISSVFPSDIIESIDFYPGNFSARYGRAMGGIIDVKTRAPRRDRWTGFADIDALDTMLFAEGPITDDISVQISARRSYFDALLPLLIPDDVEGLDLTVAPRYWDYQGRVNWRVARGHEVELFLYGSDDELEFALDRPRARGLARGNVSAGTFFHKGQLIYRYRSDLLDNDFVYNFGLNALGFNLSADAFLELDLFLHVMRNEATLKLGEWANLIFGFDIQVGTYTFSAIAPQPRQEGEVPGDGRRFRNLIELEKEGLIGQPAAFLELELTPIKPLLAVLGMRVDYENIIDETAVDIRGTLRYALLEDELTLKGGVGTYHQAPQLWETADGFGNPDLGFQDATHYAVGVEYRLPFYEALSFDVTGFYKDLDGLVSPSSQILEASDGTLRPELLANTGTGNVWGAEVLIRHELANNFFGWLSYTLMRSERIDRPGAEPRLFDFDQTHILNLIASYKLPYQIQVGMRFRFVSGRLYTPRVGGVFNSDADTYDDVPGALNSRRLEPFHSLDVRLDKSWIMEDWILSVYLDVQNVYYHANVESVQYNYDNTQQGFVTSLPILPSFGVRGQF